MREIVLDTETTGLDPRSGHRIVEIGAIELMNHVPTGKEYWQYINPERDMPSEAEAVHGISGAFLADKPVFSSVAKDFADFIGDAQLIIHNADFDMNFINHEFGRLGMTQLPSERATCTVKMSRRKFPGAPASLDALCKRFDIDLSVREKHGAVVDARLLAAVYLELIGGRQPGLSITSAADAARGAAVIARTARAPRPHAVPAEELAAHEAFIAKLANNLWSQNN